MNINHDVALCQGCLRLQPLPVLIPDDNSPPGLCPTCGGQTCNCQGCIASIDALSRGNWARSHLQDHVRPVSWSAAGGLVCDNAAPSIAELQAEAAA